MCLPVGLNCQYIINHDKKYLNLINDEILIHQQTFTAVLINGTTHRSDNPLEVKNEELIFSHINLYNLYQFFTINFSLLTFHY